MKNEIIIWPYQINVCFTDYLFSQDDPAGWEKIKIKCLS